MADIFERGETPLKDPKESISLFQPAVPDIVPQLDTIFDLLPKENSIEEPRMFGTVDWKKGQSIEEGDRLTTSKLNQQFSEETKSLSRLSNRKTEATLSGHDHFLPSLQQGQFSNASFFSERDEVAFDQSMGKESIEPSLCSQQISYKSDQMSSGRPSSYRKTQALPKSNMLCIEDLIYEQSISQEAIEPKVIKLIPHNQVLLNKLEVETRRRSRTSQGPSRFSQTALIEGKTASSSQSIAMMAAGLHQEEMLETECKRESTTGNNKEIKLDIDCRNECNLQGNNCTTLNAQSNSNNSEIESPENPASQVNLEEKDNQIQTTFMNATIPTSMGIGVSPEKLRIEESSNSSDDPEMIKPQSSRLTIHVAHDDDELDEENARNGNRSGCVEGETNNQSINNSTNINNNNNNNNRQIVNSSWKFGRRQKRNGGMQHLDPRFKHISFIEAWMHVKTMDLSKEKLMKELIRRQMSSSSQQGLVGKLFSLCTSSSANRNLSASLMQEKEQILAFSQIAFDVNDSFHLNIIYSVYCGLRHTDFCPLNGAHWQSIGFRHMNPKYNFEIAGIFGALQMLAFVFCYKDYLFDVLSYIETLDKKNEDTRVLSTNMNVHSSSSSSSSTSQSSSVCHNQNSGAISQQPTNVSQNSSSAYACQSTTNVVANEKLRQKEMSLCVILQDISKQALVWLEKGMLNQLINIEKSVMNVLNKIYFATFYIFFENFKKQNSGFLSVAIAYKSTIETVSANPQNIIDYFKRSISFYYKNRE